MKVHTMHAGNAMVYYGWDVYAYGFYVPGLHMLWNDSNPYQIVKKEYQILN